MINEVAGLQSEPVPAERDRLDPTQERKDQANAVAPEKGQRPDQTDLIREFAEFESEPTPSEQDFYLTQELQDQAKVLGPMVAELIHEFGSLEIESVALRFDSEKNAESFVEIGKQACFLAGGIEGLLTLYHRRNALAEFYQCKGKELLTGLMEGAGAPKGLAHAIMEAQQLLDLGREEMESLRQLNKLWSDRALSAGKFDLVWSLEKRIREIETSLYERALDCRNKIYQFDKEIQQTQIWRMAAPFKPKWQLTCNSPFSVSMPVEIFLGVPLLLGLVQKVASINTGKQKIKLTWEDITGLEMFKRLLEAEDFLSFQILFPEEYQIDDFVPLLSKKQKRLEEAYDALKNWVRMAFGAPIRTGEAEKTFEPTLPKHSSHGSKDSEKPITRVLISQAEIRLEPPGQPSIIFEPINPEYHLLSYIASKFVAERGSALLHKEEFTVKFRGSFSWDNHFRKLKQLGVPISSSNRQKEIKLEVKEL